PSLSFLDFSLTHPYLPPFPTRRSSDLQIVGARVAHVVRGFEEVRRLHHLAEVQVESLELPLEEIAADVDAPLPLLALDEVADPRDRKSTRLNSSHVAISYAVFCLKKKT